METGKGTFIYALHLRDNVLFVGQCEDIQKQIDEHAKSSRLQFDRFTYNFLEGIHPGTDAANTMEAIAVVRLRPLLNKGLPRTENYCTELHHFCTRYNNQDSPRCPVPLHLIEELVESQKLTPVYETGLRRYYRIADLYTLLEGEYTTIHSLPDVTLSEGGRAA
jgi:hypothetical protein